MFGSEIIKVAIGLVLVYLLLALVCTAVSEWVSRMFSMRSKTLKAGIRNLLDDEDHTFSNDIFNHALIKRLHRKGLWDTLKGRLPLTGTDGSNGPSNIPARTFALALFDKIADAGKPDGASERHKYPFDILVVGVGKLKAPPEVKKVLKLFLDSAKLETTLSEEAIVKARKSVETWFDDTMDRVSGWYKRQTQVIVLVLALGVTLFMNADTFMIANSLWNDDEAREVVVAAAEGMAQQNQAGVPPSDLVLADFQDQINELPLPVGWVLEISENPRAIPDNVTGLTVKIFGILFTTFAVALGAPFWFDLLNKFVNIRGAGATPKKDDKPNIVRLEIPV